MDTSHYEFVNDYDRINEESVTWMNYFFHIAKEVASKSKDPNTKVGAVLVEPNSHRIIGTGYNGFPSGVGEQRERWTRPTKYSFVCHAETNVIAAAAKFGTRIDGCDLYVTLHPCVDCAKLVASSGIKRIFYIDDGSDQNKGDDWRKLLTFAKTIFAEAHIRLIAVKEIVREEHKPYWFGPVKDRDEMMSIDTVNQVKPGATVWDRKNDILYTWNGVIWAVNSIGNTIM